LSLLGVLSASLFVLFVYLGFWGPLPSATELSSLKQAKVSLVYAQEGELIGSFYSVNRDPISFQDLPEHLVQALVATEDERFFEHDGVDPRSLVRVLIKTILMGDRSAGGGSTLTQQLVKNLYGRPDYGKLTMPVNKVREIILARRLEAVFSKTQILELYFNTVSFSENTYGISAGSRRFFSKEPAQLNLEEGAVLVGLLQANTSFNPRLNPERSQRRRNLVFYQMFRNDFLSQEELDSLRGLPLVIAYQNLAQQGPAPYFVAQVQRQIDKVLSGKLKENGEPWDYRNDGLKIYTSLDFSKQAALENAFQNHLRQWQRYFEQHWKNKEPWESQPSFFDRQVQRLPHYQYLASQGLSDDQIMAKLGESRSMELYHPDGPRVAEYSALDSLTHYLKLLRGASVLLNPQNGAVEAWIGGPDHNYLPFDAAASGHSMASTVKPFVIAAALEAGYSPCDYQSAERITYEQYDNWQPRNYDDKYEGAYSMAAILKKSINTATVAWYMEIGGASLRNLVAKLGIDGSWTEGPTASLGSSSVSPLNLAAAYACFANQGEQVSPYFIERIEGPNGELLYHHEQTRAKRIITAETARLVNSMLQGVTAEGTARRLVGPYGADFPWAAKTGTSQNYSDAWLVAYAPDLVSVTWMGGVNPLIRFRTGALGSGSTMALPVFGNYLKAFGNAQNRPDWPELSEEDLANLDCPDLKDPNLIEKLRILLGSDEDESPAEKEAMKRNSQDLPWWKRIFRKDTN